MGNRFDGVTVELDDGTRGYYELVLGCDGNRSNTRRLAFDDAKSASHFMGACFFLKVVLRTDLLPANASQVFSVAGCTAILTGYEDRTDIGLARRSEEKNRMRLSGSRATEAYDPRAF